MRVLSCIALITAAVALAGCSDGKGRDAGSGTAAPGNSSAEAAADSPPSPRAPCPVTVPNRKPQPKDGIGADDFNYGSSRLRAQLNWPHGTLVAGVRPDGGAIAIINSDGSIRVKVGWWRGLDGTLRVEGRRLDASASPLLADLPYGYGSQGFQPTGLTFPTVGCWLVVGKVGTASLTFVVKVTKLYTKT